MTRSHRLLSCHGPSLSLVRSDHVTSYWPLIGQVSNCLNPGHPVIKLSCPPPPQAGLQGVVFRENCPGIWVPCIRLTQTFISGYQGKQYPKSHLLYLHFAFSNLIFKHPVTSMLSNMPVKLNFLILSEPKIIGVSQVLIVTFCFDFYLKTSDSWSLTVSTIFECHFRANFLNFKFFWRLKRCPGISLTAMAHVLLKLQISVKRLNVNYSSDQKYYQGQARF